jgi:hypothetical protein
MGSESNESSPAEFASEYVTEKYRERISSELGKISSAELFSVDTQEQRIADDLILKFVGALSKFSDWEEFNRGIRILQCAIHKFGFGVAISEMSLFEEYCSRFSRIDYDEFKGVLDKMRSKSSDSVFRFHLNGLYLTDISFFVYDQYQRLKAEILSSKKSGDNENISRLFMFFRNFIINNADGIETDWLFNARYLLDAVLHDLSSRGESFLYSDTFYEQLNKLHDLIDQIIEYERHSGQGHLYSIQTITEVQQSLQNAIYSILSLSGERLRGIFSSPDVVLRRNPFPEVEKKVIELLDSTPIEELFFEDPISAWPVQLLMGVGRRTLESNILALVSESPREYIRDLPIEAPSSMGEMELTERLVKNEEFSRVLDELERLAQENMEGLDYDLVKDRNPVVFLSRLASFYQLFGQGRVDLEFDVKEITDPENFVDCFTARKYSAYISDVGDKK